MRMKTIILKRMNRLRNGFFSALDQLLGIRRGFLLGAIAGFSVVGSMLWAIPAVTNILPHQFSEPNIPSSSLVPVLRGTMPSELAWFFIQFPYVSESAEITPKNHHTFIVNDAPRRRKYVVNFGQRYRRV